MSNLKTFIADSEALKILRSGTIEGNTYRLPDVQLERSLYEDVNKILVAMGAKWNKKAKGHVFDYDIREELNKVVKTGIVTDWKKSTDFFYTPEAVVNKMLGHVNQPSQDEFIILEPSAGQGHILDLFKENFPNAKIIAVEQNPLHCERLREKGYSPICDDFLNVTPAEVDLVLMNPPFSQEAEHIQHAYKFLGEQGRLVSIASAGIFEKTYRKNKEFTQWFNDVGGYEYDLPANSFNESGTSVNTKMLIIG